MRDAGQGVLRGPNGASRLCALLGLVSITVGLLAAIGGTAAAATRPHFRPHAHVISRGQVLTMRLDVGRARHCTLFERGPGGRHLKHRYGVSPPAALFTVAARSSTAHGRWRLSMLCRTARDRRLTVARTSVRVVRTHGAGVLGGADVAAWPDASTPQRRTISGAGFGGGPVPNPFEIGQCTWWAFNMRAEVYLDSVNSGAPKGGWNGGAWKTYAAIGHFPEGTAPRVGALVSYGPGTNADPGHVAYVTQVIDNDHFVTSEMNTDGANLKSYRVFTRYYWRGTPGAGSRGYRYTKNLPGDARFIYAKPQPLEGAPVSIQGSNIPIQGSSTPIQGTATPQPGTGGASPTPAPTSAPTPAPTPAPPPPAPSISASKGGPYGGGFTLNIAVHNFPTGTFVYTCHDNSGPGGSDSAFYSHAVTVTNPNQSTWPGVFCYDSGGYVAYLTMAGYRSNNVQF